VKWNQIKDSVYKIGYVIYLSIILVLLYELLVIFISIGTWLSTPIFIHVDPNNNYLEITSSVVLLLATLIYVSYTGKIAKETSINTQITTDIIKDARNDREIAYKEKQPEKFYYPLIEFLKHNIYVVVNENNGNKYDELRVRSTVHRIEQRYKNPLYKDITTHVYLANADTSNFARKHLDSFLKLERDADVEKIKRYRAFKMMVQNDIDEILADLDELRK
jgi:hypothetical protein